MCTPTLPITQSIGSMTSCPVIELCKFPRPKKHAVLPSGVMASLVISNQAQDGVEFTLTELPSSYLQVKESSGLLTRSKN